MSFKKKLLLFALLFGAVLAALVGYSSMQVHATRAEQAEPLPGDDLIPHPVGAVTHAITIHRPPQDAWPWLVHMGSGRAVGERTCRSGGWQRHSWKPRSTSAALWDTENSGR